MNAAQHRSRSRMMVSTDLARGLTMRLGFVFLGLILLVIFTSRIATSTPAAIGSNWPWLVVIVATAISGLVNLRLCRVPGQIQAELLHTEGDPRRWNEIRPMAGSGPIVNAWNSLLEQAHYESPQPESPAHNRNSDSQTALMARAMRSVSAGVAVTDSDFLILAFNGPVAALLGMEDLHRGSDYHQAAETNRNRGLDLRDKNILDILSAIAERSADNRSLKQDLARLAGGGTSITVRLKCGSIGQPKDGAGKNPEPIATVPQADDSSESRVLRISRTRLNGRDGDIEGFAWLIQDITQQVLASASRDQFLQTATHELRTPLANLRAYAEALSIESGVSVEEQKEFCNIIMDETNRLSRLVDHLLTVGQLEAGSLVIQQHSLDPARILEEAIEYTKPQIAAANLNLQTEISPKLRKIVGDKDKLQAVLVNLIGNAAKYTPAGGNIRIVAKLRQDTLEVAVEDSGIGIGPEDLPRVFEKFYRVQNEHVSKQTGNGLGLSFAREVARLHQGDITVESQLGEGSVFTLRLPAPDEPQSKT